MSVLNTDVTRGRGGTESPEVSARFETSMVDLPLVSIVTPSLNQGEFLEDTLLSVANQTYPHIEHLVIDGGSTDRTLELLRKYESRYALRWCSERDTGQAHAVNKGFAQAKGDIVAWLNSDDVYFSPTTISQVVEGFRQRPAAGVLYGDTALINAEGLIYRFLPSLKRVAFRRLGYYCPSLVSSFMRRQVVQAFPLRDDLHYRMDHEYWVRLCRAGVLFSYVPKVWAAFRVHPKSKTTALGYALDEDLLRIRRQYFHGSWQVRWPVESVLRRSVGAWLRLRGAARLGELYETPLAFPGKRMSRLAFYRYQLFSRTFDHALLVYRRHNFSVKGSEV